jgi:dephospho-CoA kinase
VAFGYAVALTGGIATGKSSVAEMFAADGFAVIDADKIAHEVLEREKEQIADMFGDAMVKEGKVDRKALGTAVFADPLKRKELERLLHPLIFEEIEARAETEDKKQRPYIVDIPLFFEGKRYPIAHSLVVYASPSQQIERAMLRDALSKEAVLERMAAQIDIGEKRDMADFVIDNSQDQTQLRVEYERIRALIEEMFV